MTASSDPEFTSKPAPDGYRYAGAWIRLAALTIDGLILLVVAFALVFGIGVLALLAYPNVALDIDGWPAWAMAYVAMSAAMLAWYGGWQSGIGATPGMLALKLWVRDPSGEGKPSLAAAVTRNLPMVLMSFGSYSGSQAIDATLGIVTLAVYIAIGISISNSPTRQGFHDRLAGGTYVLRRA